MALGGPYFSLFLLYVLFAHAGRHIRDDDPRFPTFNKGEHFIMKAKQLLLDEMETPRSDNSGTSVSWWPAVRNWQDQ